MVIYADTSFIVRLMTNEAGSDEAISLYRSLGRPPLFFTALHELEVRNGLRLKAFASSRSSPSRGRGKGNATLESWESRLERRVTTGSLLHRDVDWHAGIERALILSTRHTLQLGTRAFDILHVAFALQLGCKDFVTADLRQAALAKAAGLKTSVVSTG